MVLELGYYRHRTTAHHNCPGWSHSSQAVSKCAKLWRVQKTTTIRHIFLDCEVRFPHCDPAPD